MASETSSARVGAELRALRESKGLKAYWVAERVGVSASELSLLESGKRGVKPEMERKWREVLNK